MSKKHTIKPLAIAISAVFAATIAGTSTASADTTPFSMTSLTSGYQVAHLGEGSCGGDKGDKGKEGLRIVYDCALGASRTNNGCET